MAQFEALVAQLVDLVVCFTCPAFICPLVVESFILIHQVLLLVATEKKKFFKKIMLVYLFTCDVVIDSLTWLIS